MEIPLVQKFSDSEHEQAEQIDHKGMNSWFDQIVKV